MGKQDKPPACRTCNGSGSIDHWVENDKGKMVNQPQTCHACGGSG